MFGNPAHDDELVEGHDAVPIFIGLLHDRVRLARDLGVARRHVVRPQDARELALRDDAVAVFVLRGAIA